MSDRTRTHRPLGSGRPRWPLLKGDDGEWTERREQGDFGLRVFWRIERGELASPPPTPTIRASYKIGWSQLFVPQRGIAWHISSSSVTRWEEMTLPTVNYSQPISPLQTPWPLCFWAHVSVRCRRLPGEFSISSASEGSSARRATKIGLQVGRKLSLFHSGNHLPMST